MNIKLNIFKALIRKASVLIFLVLFISISFTPGGALADNCQGGADCLKCTAPAHSHVPGTHMDMAPHGCQPADQNSTCGFETSQIPDEFQGIVSSDRPYYQAHTGIFAAASDEYGQTRLPDEFVPQFHFSDSGGTAPFYLLNQALLC